MFNFLLKKNSLKLNILLKLSNQKLTNTELVNEFNLPQTTLSRILESLNNDLSYISKNTCSIQKDSKKKFSLNTNTSSLAIFQRLKLFYLKESPHFNLLSLLITQNSCEIEQISNELFISESHIYHLIKELNLQLNKYNLIITSSTNRRQFEITGDEFTLRCFIFRILNESYQIIEWPFKHISSDEIILQLNKTSLNKINVLSENQINQLLFYLVILNIRLKKGKIIKNITSPILSILTILKADANSSRHIENFLHSYSLENDSLDKESLMFNVFIRLLIPSVFTNEQENRIGKKILNSTSPFFLFINPLCEEFIDTFKLINEDFIEYKLCYALTMHQLFQQLININLDTLLSTTYKPKANFPVKTDYHFLEIKKFYEKYLKKNSSNLVFDSDGSTNRICTILSVYLDSYTHSSLNIFLNFSKNNFGRIFMSQKILSHFSPLSISLTNNFFEADIVISDSMEKEHADKQYFYMYDTTNRKQLFDMIKFINKCLLIDKFEENEII